MEAQAHANVEAYDNEILMFLSMNCRLPIKAIAKDLRLNENAVSASIKRLEKKYGIKYTLSFDLLVEGYTEYIALGKFSNGRPSQEHIEKLKKLLEADPQVQIAMQVSGAYDIIAYYIAKEDQMDGNAWSVEKELAKFSKYMPEGNSIEWSISWIDVDYGKVVLRREFVKELGKHIMEKDMAQAEEKKRQVAVIEELLEDSRIAFNSIDKKLGFSQNTSYNIAKKLFNEKLINWYTITMENSPAESLYAIYMKIVNEGKFLKKREELMESIIEKTDSPIDKYMFIADVNAPRGIMFFAGTRNEAEFGKIKKELESIDGTELEVMKINKILFGSFFIRKFDNAYSGPQSVLIEQYWKTHQKIEKRSYYREI
ncbi:MAG: Lrp/AsnC family transcriptional regulator [Candidatus Micrarchaeaceae archaeon]